MTFWPQNLINSLLAPVPQNGKAGEISPSGVENIMYTNYWHAHTHTHVTWTILLLSMTNLTFTVLPLYRQQIVMVSHLYFILLLFIIHTHLVGLPITFLSYANVPLRSKSFN